jgi:prevent-host-death family protein
MRTVNVHEAKTHLSALLLAVEAGEEIVISRAGHPIARLTGLPRDDAQLEIGCDAGLPFRIADDFDTFIPEEFREYVE